MALICSGLLDNTRGPAYPYILEQFGLTNSEGSLFFAIAAFSSLLIILSGRFLLERFGEIVCQRAFLFLMFVATICMGSSSYFGGYPLLIFSAFMLGFGLGGSSLGSNILLALGSPENKRRQLFSGLHSMYGLSSLIAPLLFGLVIRMGGLWGGAFVLLSLTILVPLIIAMRTKKVATGVHQIIAPPEDVGRLERIMIGLPISLYVMAEVAVSSRLVLYAGRELKIDPTDATYYLSLFFALLLAGRLIFSLIPFKTRTYRIMTISLASSLLFLIAGIFVHPIFLSICGLSMSIYFPCGMDAIIKAFAKNSSYMIISVLVSMFTGLILMHWSIGVFADIAGLKMAMLVAVVAIVLAWFFLIMNKRRFDHA